jgi:hypothetical protein
MKETEQTKAANYRAEGEAKARELIADALAAQQRILAVAQRRVDEIRNRTQREVSEIYKDFAEHQDLRIYLDKLEAIEEILKRRSTLILEPDEPPIDLFDEEKRLSATVPIEVAQETIEGFEPQAEAQQP